MKIAVLTGCQMEGFVSALQILLPEAQVEGFHTYRLLKPDRAEILESLRSADLVFALPMDPQFGDLAEDTIHDVVPNVRLVPHVNFPAFHPDIVYITKEGSAARVQSPLTDYNSNIVASAFLLGLDVERTLKLFNSYVYQALGYFDVLPHSRRELLDEFGRYDIDLSAAIGQWLGHAECFMYSHNHPKGYVLADVALEAARTAGLNVPATFPCPDMMPDRLAQWVMYPVYPEIATRLGKRGHMCFKALSFDRMNVLRLDDFVERSFRMYEEDDPAKWILPERVEASKATLSALLG